MRSRKLVFPIIILLAVSLNAKWETADYLKYDHKNFRSNPDFSIVIDDKNIDYRLINAAVFFVTNETRVKLGKKPLEYASQLETAAWTHAKRMVEKNFFSHTDATDAARRTPSQRGGLSGIKNPALAENINEYFGIKYKGGTSIWPVDRSQGIFSSSSGGPIIPNHTYLSLAEALVEGWMNSPGHRSNILSDNGLQMGCGVYFYRDTTFYNMLKCKGVQKFQWFHKIEPGPAVDSMPGMQQLPLNKPATAEDEKAGSGLNP
jgi:uncharacterized protein YkwD